MARNGFARMDFDTRWPFDRKVRRLQRLYPEAWPAYWAAYFALVGEAWASRSRDVTLTDAWINALPVPEEEAAAALIEVKLLDPDGQIPEATWSAWYGTAEARIEQRRAAGLAGNEARWGRDRIRSRSDRDPDGIPSQPASQPKPAKASQNARAGARDALVLDELNALDLTNPAELWEYLFGKAPTDRQREAFLDNWIQTEGRRGACELLSQAHAARAGGDRDARDHVAWIHARVTARRAERASAAAADLETRKRRAATVSSEVEARYREAVGVWSDRGKDPADFTFSREDPGSVMRYLAQHGGGDDGHTH